MRNANLYKIWYACLSKHIIPNVLYVIYFSNVAMGQTICGIETPPPLPIFIGTLFRETSTLS